MGGDSRAGGGSRGAGQAGKAMGGKEGVKTGRGGAEAKGARAGG